MTFNDIIMKAFEFGPMAAVAVYLIYRQSVDYKGVCKRLNDVEDWQKGEMSELVKSTVEALNTNSGCIREISNTIKNCKGKNNE